MTHFPAFRVGWRSSLLLLFACVLLGGTGLYAHEHFQAWAQEDGWIEWATFWSFLGAALLYGLLLREPRESGASSTPGTLLFRLGAIGLAAFCLFVAGEEISWGQRLFAIEPPDYFLEHNYQQELNLHNLLASKGSGPVKLDSRYLVAGIAALFGIVLPLASEVRWLASLERLRPVRSLVPPPSLIPFFFLVAVTELRYPFDFAGEACELLLGTLFLVAAATRLTGGKPRRSPVASPDYAVTVAFLLGMATPTVLDATVYAAGAEETAIAEKELSELANDIPRAANHRKLTRKRTVHKRLFTAVRSGYFSFEGNPFFLDPWNNPYWVYWSRNRRTVLLYSFGPNRRRDSNPASARVGGDDIATVIPLER